MINQTKVTGCWPDDKAKAYQKLINMSVAFLVVADRVNLLQKQASKLTVLKQK